MILNAAPTMDTESPGSDAAEQRATDGLGELGKLRKWLPAGSGLPQGPAHLNAQAGTDHMIGASAVSVRACEPRQSSPDISP